MFVATRRLSLMVCRKHRGSALGHAYPVPCETPPKLIDGSQGISYPIISNTIL